MGTPHLARTSGEESLNALLFSPLPATVAYAEWGQQQDGSGYTSVNDTHCSSYSSSHSQMKYTLPGKKTCRGNMDMNVLRGATSVPVSIPKPSHAYTVWGRNESSIANENVHGSGLNAKYVGGENTTNSPSPFVFQLDDVPRETGDFQTYNTSAPQGGTSPSQWYSTVRIGWEDTSPNDSCADGHQEEKTPRVSMARRKRFNLQRFNLTVQSRKQSCHRDHNNKEVEAFLSFRQTLPAVSVLVKELEGS